LNTKYNEFNIVSLVELHKDNFSFFFWCGRASCCNVKVVSSSLTKTTFFWTDIVVCSLQFHRYYVTS